MPSQNSVEGRVDTPGVLSQDRTILSFPDRREIRFGRYQGKRVPDHVVDAALDHIDSEIPSRFYLEAVSELARNKPKTLVVSYPLGFPRVIAFY